MAVLRAPRIRMNEARTRAGRIALIGRPNVGKSTLLNALLGEPIAIVSPHPQTTRDLVRGVLTREDTQYTFVDSPGIHEARNRLGGHMNATARQASHDADVLVLVVEVTADPADDRLVATLPSAKTVLAINKIDQLKDKGAAATASRSSVARSALCRRRPRERSKGRWARSAADRAPNALARTAFPS